MLSLIFFVLFFLLACRQNKKEEISIVWKDKEAVAIAIPKKFLDGNDSISQLLRIRLENSETDILGKYNSASEEIIFTPFIPFTHGMLYQIFFRDKLVEKITIPPADVKEAARLVAIYPSADTVPENLLKIYLHFSAPMREGEALRHIALLDSKNDSLPGVFLDLQPELWNKDRTVLTLWLDPGRIKRDLIPNQEMGNPLKKGQQYILAVSPRWENVQGLPLQQAYSKKIFVAGRDSLSPQPGAWAIHSPKAESKDPLKVNAGEPLDYFLLQETMSIIDGQENIVRGTITISDKERGFEFNPAKSWKKGRYKIQVAAYLEDLAGNNLQRLFDRDIQKQPEKKVEEFFERGFVISQ